MVAENISHIAFIMDGNRRYATKEKISVASAYDAGLKKLFLMIEICQKFEIKHFTFFVLSKDNFAKRKKNELFILEQLMLESFSTLRDYCVSKNIYINIIGNYSKINQDLAQQLEVYKTQTKVADCKYVLTLAMNYSSREEILLACSSLAMSKDKTQFSVQEFTKYLYPNCVLPDPNLLIRTGGCFRLSDFLLWELQYAELFFLEELWPEMSENILHNCLEIYQNRYKVKTYGR